MAEADVFVAPALLESFGIAALEAQAAALPVVGRSGNGLSDFIADGEGGVLVDSDRQMATVLAGMATTEAHKTPRLLFAGDVQLAGRSAAAPSTFTRRRARRPADRKSTAPPDDGFASPANRLAEPKT